MTDSVDLLVLPFDQYQRYLAAAQIVDRARAHLDRPRLRVLDVGGFSQPLHGDAILPLVHFLPHDHVTVVDLVAASPHNYALASGLALPFGDQAFDLVVTCDTLEHIPSADRSAFLDELLRAAGSFLFLIAPFDSESNHRAERLLYEYMTGQGAQNRQLEEHLELGLPSLSSLRSALAERELASIDFTDGYLHHWLPMMLFKHTPGLPQDLQIDLDRFYNRHYSPYDRREPGYRHAFVVAKPGHEALLSTIAAEVRSIPSPVFPRPEFGSDLGHLLQQSQLVTLTVALRESESRLSHLEVENAELHQLVAGYEQGRFIRLMSWLHERRHRVRR